MAYRQSLAWQEQRSASPPDNTSPSMEPPGRLSSREASPPRRRRSIDAYKLVHCTLSSLAPHTLYGTSFFPNRQAMKNYTQKSSSACVSCTRCDIATLCLQRKSVSP